MERFYEQVIFKYLRAEPEDHYFLLVCIFVVTIVWFSDEDGGCFKQYSLSACMCACTHVCVVVWGWLLFLGGVVVLGGGGGVGGVNVGHG